MLVPRSCGADADFTLIVGDHRFPCDSALLASRSDVLATAIARSRPKSALEIDCESPQIAGSFLRYVYTDDAGELDFGSSSALLLMADRYNVPGLKRACELHLANHLCVENCARTLDVANKSNSDELKKLATRFMGRNIEALTEAAGGWSELGRTFQAVAGAEKAQNMDNVE